MFDHRGAQGGRGFSFGVQDIPLQDTNTFNV